MRLFVFAIGGTGSRVLESMIMQFAAGARPTDEQGKEIENLSVVPIIVDPHEGNQGLQDANKLLCSYRKLRESIYGKESGTLTGFFGVKIETLHDVSPKEEKTDTFFFRMQNVSDNTFGRFIGLAGMDPKNKLFAQMLFS